jgi:hypothetical protein
LRALILIGGIFHDFADSAGALARVLGAAGFASEVTEDVDGALGALPQWKEPPLVVLNALRWGMSQHEKYEPYRARWALAASPAMRHGLESHLARGGGLLGLHTASICFDDWPQWPGLLGAGWQWGRSHHPPPAPARVTLAPVEHPITRGGASFEVVDEVYHELAVAADAQPLWSAQAAGDAAPLPVAWARRHGAGRVVYDALGHDAASVGQPAHARLLARAAAWCASRPEAEWESLQ